MTFDDIREGAFDVPRAVTITGTRSTGHRPDTEFAMVFAEYLGPFAVAGSEFYIGGATGIDTLTLRWLAEQTPVALTVVVPCALSDQPSDATTEIERLRRTGRLTDVVELAAQTLDASAYHARNRWMVDHSEFVIGFPRGSDPTSGTWYTLDYAAGRGLPRLVVPV